MREKSIIWPAITIATWIIAALVVVAWLWMWATGTVR